MKYYLIQPDGTSLFSLPYEKDFLIHCLIILMGRDIDTTGYRLLIADSSLSAYIASASLANTKTIPRGSGFVELAWLITKLTGSN